MPRGEGLLVAALAAGLLAAILGPALPVVGTAFLGSEYVDHYGTQWFYWFVERGVRGGTELGHTDLFFHPYGKDIFGHTGTNVLDALAAIPVRALLGPVLGYNAFVLLGALASAAAFHRLARRFTDDPTALAVATLLVGTSPYVLFELVEGRPTQAILLLPILFLDQLFATAERPGWRAPLLTGLLLAATAWQYWYYGLFGGALALGLLAVARPPPDSGGARAVLRRHAAAAAITALLVAPAALPMVQKTLAGDSSVPGLLNTALWTWGDQTPATVEGTVVGLYTWQPLRMTAGFFARNKAGAEIFLDYVRLVPIPALLLAAFGLWRAPRHRAPLVLGIGLCALLALGPTVMVGDLAFPNPPYILLAKALPVVRRLWWPARAMVFVVLLGGVALAMGLAALRRHGPAWLPVAALLAVLGQGWHLAANHMLPFPTWDATVPAGYRCLAQGPPGAIIELPYAFTQAHLYYQTVHGRPMLGGMIENNPVFTPTESIALRSENSFVRRVLAIGSSLKDVPEEWTEEDKEATRDLGYRYVVLQKDAFDTQFEDEGLLDNAIKARRRMLLRDLARMVGRPVYDDERVSIYAPWGDPLPCAADPPPPDPVAVGIPDHPWFVRTFDSPFALVVRRPFGQVRPLEDYLGSPEHSLPPGGEEPPIDRPDTGHAR